MNIFRNVTPKITSDCPFNLRRRLTGEIHETKWLDTIVTLDWVIIVHYNHYRDQYNQPKRDNTMIKDMIEKWKEKKLEKSYTDGFDDIVWDYFKKEVPASELKQQVNDFKAKGSEKQKDIARLEGMETAMEFVSEYDNYERLERL